MSDLNENSKNDDDAKPSAETVIKKYANRRLYNTATSSYVTLDYLSDMVKNGDDFVVIDAKSGDDITHSVLTQIIFEEENKGNNLLPIQFLRQLIKFYGDSLQNFVPSYLEASMNAFSKNQKGMRDNIGQSFTGAPGYALLEEVSRKNMELFSQTMSMFMPENKTSTHQNAAAEETQSDEIDALKLQLSALQRQLDNIEKKNN